MSSIKNTFKQGYAQWQKSKSYYATIVVSLSFTLAVMFSVFGIVDAVYLKPLPYSQSESLHRLDGNVTYQGSVQVATNPPALLNIKNNSHSIESMGLYFSLGTQKRMDRNDRLPVEVFFGSPDLFKVLGVTPHIGRFFDARESTGNNQPSAVLSYKVWQQQFGSKVDIVGSSINLDNKVYTIVGVTPDNWALPEYSGVSNAVWLPLDMSSRDVKQFAGFSDAFAAIVKLKPDVTPEVFSNEADVLYYQGAELASPDYTKVLAPKTRIQPLVEAIRGDSGKIAWMLVIAAVLLAVIALINLGNLQIARAVSKTKSLAVSYAFGATKRQIFVELFRHNLWLVGASAILALVLAFISFEFVIDAAGDAITRIETIAINGYMLLFTVLITLFVTFVFSYIEMQAADEQQLLNSLQSSGKGSAKQLKKGISHTLIGLQICFSLMTLLATSQVLSSALSEALRPTQINLDELTVMKLDYSDVPERETRVSLNTSFQAELRNMEGVENVSYSSEMRVDEINRDFIYNDKNEKVANVRQILVDPLQHTLYGMEIDGRGFSKEDTELENFPVIINQRLAQKFSDNPVGQSLILGDKLNHKIVGVVSNTNFPGQSYREDEEVYIPRIFEGNRYAVFLVKSNQPINKVKAITALNKVDPRIKLVHIEEVEQQFFNLSKHHRFAAYIAGSISVISVLMVIAGVVGMVSYMVNLRRYDLGVKMAMGAHIQGLTKSQLLELLAPIGAAVLLGFSVVFYLMGYSRTIPSFVYEINWNVSTAVVLMIMLLSALACYFPIRRVLASNPIDALRNN